MTLIPIEYEIRPVEGKLIADALIVREYDCGLIGTIRQWIGKPRYREFCIFRGIDYWRHEDGSRVSSKLSRFANSYIDSVRRMRRTKAVCK